MKMIRMIASLAVPLLLTGCFLSPGKFSSTLDLQRDGRFTFTYVGEIIVTDTSSQVSEFSPNTCYDDTGDNQRACTDEELAQQRAEFAAAQQAGEGDDGLISKGLGAFGSDESIAALVDQLKKQDGWKSVRYRGDHIIDVEYAITGMMSHGFAFPLVEGGGGVMPFVTLTRRKDGGIKLSAPAYSSGGAGREMASLASLAGAAASSGKPAQPKAEGRFTVTTNGRILTNNTDDGPATKGERSVLTWDVDSRRDKAPEALIGLDTP